jgi:hypothetical protein
MQMDRMTLKSSTIFIAVGNRTRVYHSMDQVPESLRRRLEESTNSVNSATILIADKRGRHEIVRALRGLPSELRSRLTSSLSTTRSRKTVSTAQPIAEPVSRIPAATSGAAGFFRRYWVEFAVPTGVGVLIWLTLQYVGR